MPDHVAGFLQRHRLASGHLTLGLSGGLDSRVLLDVLARLGVDFSVLHVNHGLSPHAGEWEAFCAELAGRLGVPFTAQRVDARPAPGESPEAAARRARYQAYRTAPGDVLLLAQHQDDQAETVLLQLLRGAGPRGLAAMPEVRALADGKLLARPLLDIPRRQILDHARRHGLQWIEDESNRDPRFSRNFLRREVFPALERHYPAYRQALGRAARHAAEAAGRLDELAALDLAQESSGETLDIERLRRLDGPRGRNALRYFLAQNGIGHPPCEELEEIRRQLLDASPESGLAFVLDGKRLQRYRGVAKVVADALPFRGEWFFCWNGEERLSLAGGWLHFASCRGEGLRKSVLLGVELCLRPRQGGEKLRTHPGGPRRSLKHLFQEYGVPPWQRLATPMLWQAERLLWVPGVGANADCMARPGEEGVCLRWVSG